MYVRTGDMFLIDGDICIFIQVSELQCQLFYYDSDKERVTNRWSNNKYSKKHTTVSYIAELEEMEVVELDGSLRYVPSNSNMYKE